MRIIDADRAKEIAEVSFGDIFLQTAVKLLLDKTPSIDAVPVVRCKDCTNAGCCYAESVFKIAKVENPYCCAGKEKTNEQQK